MHKSNKTPRKGKLLPYRYSIVYHPVRQELGLTIFEYCLLETLVRHSNQNEYSKGVKFLAEYLFVTRKRAYDALKKFAGRGWITGDAETRTLSLNSEVFEMVNEAGKANGENLKYTQIFHALRNTLDVDFKSYCLLDAVFHLSKAKGISEASPTHFEKWFDLPERDFYRKRNELDPYLIRTGVFWLKLKPKIKAEFAEYETLLQKECSKTAE